MPAMTTCESGFLAIKGPTSTRILACFRINITSWSNKSCSRMSWCERERERPARETHRLISFHAARIRKSAVQTRTRINGGIAVMHAEDRIRDLADKDAIRELLYLYCVGSDRMDTALVESVFYGDARLHYGYFDCGPKELS